MRPRKKSPIQAIRSRSRRDQTTSTEKLKAEGGVEVVVELAGLPWRRACAWRRGPSPPPSAPHLAHRPVGSSSGVERMGDGSPGKLRPAAAGCACLLYIACERNGRRAVRLGPWAFTWACRVTSQWAGTTHISRQQHGS